VNHVGMANLVDSLLAIKQVVFEEKRATLKEMADAVRANFEGYEYLHAYVLNKCEKFGNDLEESNALMKELVDFASTETTYIKNTRGFHYVPGYYTAHHQAAMGMFTGATPDGRLAGVSLSNSLCPVQGMDKNSPTALINSVTQPDHELIRNGVAIDLKFSPSLFKNPMQRKMFRPLVETCFKKGSQEIQFNVVNKDTLLAAQREPEKYQNLLIRVSGYSAYFTSLFKEEQDEIIARTTYEQM